MGEYARAIRLFRRSVNSLSSANRLEHVYVLFPILWSNVLTHIESSAYLIELTPAEKRRPDMFWELHAADLSVIESLRHCFAHCTLLLEHDWVLSDDVLALIADEFDKASCVQFA